MLIPINLTGGDYQHKSRPLTNQVTRNFWPQPIQTPKAKSQYVLQSFYGLKQWTDPAVGGVDRGAITNKGILYRVVGTTLYQVNSDKTHTNLGTISGSNRCILGAMGSQIIVVNGSGTVYIWNGTLLTQMTDPNLGSPRSVAVLNNQAIYDAGTGQGFDVSDVGTPETINGLNNASAESDSDDLLRAYAYRESLLLMGTKTIENWWNSGQGNPPFDRIQGAIINIGLGALNSMADNPDYVFFLGSDFHVHTLTGGSSAVDTIVSTNAMAKQFQGYETISDAIGWTMQLEGQWFYVLTFPVQNVTWVLPVGGEWFQWGSSSVGRIRANSYANIYGAHLVFDYQSSVIYELDAETYTDNGENIVRTRQTASLHGGLFRADGLDFEINSIEVILETGVGLLEGQGSDPRLMISVSKDGGKTFGTERFLKCGGLGTRRKVKTSGMGRYNECVIRLRVSDPIFWAIYSAVAYVEICA